MNRARTTLACFPSRRLRAALPAAAGGRLVPLALVSPGVSVLSWLRGRRRCLVGGLICMSGFIFHTRIGIRSPRPETLRLGLLPTGLRLLRVDFQAVLIISHRPSFPARLTPDVGGLASVEGRSLSGCASSRRE